MNLECLGRYLQAPGREQAETHNTRMIWVGDFNWHHLMWDEERNPHHFISANLDAAQPLLNLLARHDMAMALPKGIPTLEALNTKNYTRPNNVFCSSQLLGAFISCKTVPAAHPPHTNHLPVQSEIDTDLSTNTPATHPNYRATDWGRFTDHLKMLLSAIPPPRCIETAEGFNAAVANLTQAIQATIGAVVPVSKPTPFSKQWWTSDLRKARQKMRSVGQISYTNRI